MNKRVKTATSCKDCDYIPKIKNAGKSFSETKNSKSYQLMHNGVKVRLGGYHEGWMKKIISELKGHHEPQEEKVFYEVLKRIAPGSTMIELGSFWAYYSCWFNKVVDRAKNYLIEPNIDKLNLGKENFKLNCLYGEFTHAFVGRESKDIDVFSDWDGKEYKIPKLSIDDFVTTNNIGRVHILHSDIQGVEFEMLEGCSKLLSNHLIDYLFISTHGDQHEKCLRLLRDFQYKLIASHTISESYSGDGLIVCHSNRVPDLKVEVSKRKMNINDYVKIFKNKLVKLYRKILKK